MLLIFLLVIVHHVCFTVASVIPLLDGYNASCYNAKNVYRGTVPFCSMVDWKTANLYNSSRFNIYNPGNQLNLIEQDEIAKFIATTIMMTTESGSVSNHCKTAIKRLACTMSFPYCGFAGSSVSSVSYLPSCKLQCDQVNQICNAPIQSSSIRFVDCDRFKLDRNCLLNIPENRFLLRPGQGPFVVIPVLYVVVLVIWILLYGVWTYQVDIAHAKSALPISKALFVIPFLRVTIAALSLFFWLDCAEHGFACRSDIAAAVRILYPFVEAISRFMGFGYCTGQMFFFLAASKGWGVTRQFLSLEVWRLHIALSFAFYVTLTVLSWSMEVGTESWILFTVLTYGLLYTLALANAWKEMSVLHAQVRKLTPSMASLATVPLRKKHSLYVLFLLLLLAEVCLEVVCRSLMASRTAPFFVVLFVYELGSAALLCGMGMSFQPSVYSPFYFMAPTSLEWRQDNGLDILNDGEGTTEESRVRRMLNNRAHHREREDDIAALELLRRTRVQRPSPIVELLLRSMVRPNASFDPLAEDESELLTTLEHDTAIQMQHISIDNESEGQQQQLARDTLSMGQILRASTFGVARQRTTDDWGMGGDHQLSVGIAEDTGRGDERIIVLTSPSPIAESAEVLLAVQHTRRIITTARTS